MGNLDTLSDILMSQIEFFACDDNFNNDDGQFDQELFDRGMKKSETLLGLTKQMIEITKTQTQIVDVACKWGIKPKGATLTIADVPRGIE